MKINADFIITFIPKHPEKFNNRKRFSVGAWSLWKYIGEENAAKLLTKILGHKGPKAKEKYSKKYRSIGEVIFYAK